MDNELPELEAELKRLRPVAPSPALRAGIGRELAPPRRTFWAWTALPLAAGLAGLLLLRDRPAAPAPAPAPAAAAVAVASVATYKPVSAENLLYAQRDEGLVTLADGTTAQRFRSSYVDTITWKNPRTQASLRWSVPRTEERVVPVSFQ
jgi:hypothetical protein